MMAAMAPGVVSKTSQFHPESAHNHDLQGRDEFSSRPCDLKTETAKFDLIRVRLVCHFDV